MPVDTQQQALYAVPRQRWTRLAVAYLVLGGAALVLAPRVDSEAWWVHGVWCFTGMAIALPMLSHTVRHGFALVLTDHRWMFLASFTVYFLFGASLLAVGPEAQAESALRHFPIGADAALRVDGVNGVGFGIALLAATRARGRFLGNLTSRVAAQASRVSQDVVVAGLLLTGVAASAYVLVVELRMPDGFVPGIAVRLSQLSVVAIVLAASRSGRRERLLRMLAIGVALALSTASAMQFNKSGALIPMAALVAGLALRFDSRKVLPIGVVFLVAGYFALGNVSSVGRSIDWQTETWSDYWGRFSAAWTTASAMEDEEGYSYWGRLCYVPTSAAGLQFQDEGRGGDGMSLMWWVAVPRFLAPQKPEMTKTGRELFEKITGRDTSADGQGIFASGYYHGGWWGLLFGSAVCGWIVAQTSSIARAIHVKQGLPLLPLSLLGLFIAFRIDGDFVSDYLGAFVFILYPILAAAVFLPPPGKMTARVAPPA